MQLLTDKIVAATKWKEHCEELYHEDNPITPTFTVREKKPLPLRSNQSNGKDC